MNIKKNIKNVIKKIALKHNKKDIIPISHPVDNTQLLQGKVALIIGGTGGIGFAIAQSFVESGCKVILAGTNEEKLLERSYSLGDGKSKYIVINLQDTHLFDGKILIASKLYGSIDILVNAAGVHSMNDDFWNIDENEYDKILDINLKGPYFLNRAVGYYMIQNNIKGHILNIASSVALEPAWTPYRLSKLGIRGYTEGLATILLPYGITVNSIAPGTVSTSLIGYHNGDAINSEDNRVGRNIMPDEIAAYAKLMVSDLGNMIVGDTLYISGGRGTIDVR